MNQNPVHAFTRPYVTCFAAAVLLAFNAMDGRSDEPQKVKWVLPVASMKASEELTPRLTELKKVLHNEVFIQYQERGNPVCVFWVEITHGKPRPDAGGYIIVIQDGGAVLRASDLEQLDLAIDRLKQVVEVAPDGVYLPVGLLTNYPIIETQ